MTVTQAEYRLGSTNWSGRDERAAAKFHATKAPDDKRAFIDLSADEHGVYREDAPSSQ